MNPLFALLAVLGTTNAYWLMGMTDTITTERIDPIVNPGKVAGHVHTVVGGSNFRMTANTAMLRQSECTSAPIVEDKSNYWVPTAYFQWANGSFSSVDGGFVIYYLFDDKPGTTTAFPDDFRMISGDPFLRTYDANSFAQQAVTFLCLDFNGVTTKHNSFPKKLCPSGIRAQVNFPSCWNGKDVDSPDHKSHVAFRSGGPDSGSCTDPKFPVNLPRIFVEVYLNTGYFDKVRSQAMTPDQPFVYSNGDRTGYSYHADFLNGWDKGVLQRAVDGCTCNIYGDPTCCAERGIFSLANKDKHCKITKAIDEQTTGTLSKLPGANPIQAEGKRAVAQVDTSPPPMFLSPIKAYRNDVAPPQGTPVPNPNAGVSSSVAAQPSSTAVSSSAASSPSSTKVDTPAPSSTKVDTPAPSSTKVDTPAPSSSKVDTPVPSSTKVDTPPSSTKVDTPAPSSTKVDTPAPSSSKVDTPAPSSSKVDTPSPSSTKVDTPGSSSTKIDIPAPSSTKATSPSPSSIKVVVPSSTKGQVPAPSASSPAQGGHGHGHGHWHHGHYFSGNGGHGNSSSGSCKNNSNKHKGYSHHKRALRLSRAHDIN